jgi:hypothetical protein
VGIITPTLQKRKVRVRGLNLPEIAKLEGAEHVPSNSAPSFFSFSSCAQKHSSLSDKVACPEGSSGILETGTFTNSILKKSKQNMIKLGPDYMRSAVPLIQYQITFGGSMGQMGWGARSC